MKILTAVLLAAALTYSANAAVIQPVEVCAAESALNVTNRTGADIFAVYIAKTGTEQWSENLLAARLKNREVAALPFKRDGVCYIWDMKIIDKNFGETIIEKLSLSDIYDIKLLPNGITEYDVIKRTT